MGAIAIIPAHNEAVTVASVASAVLASEVFDDLVVVDDGSTDETARVATPDDRELARRSSRCQAEGEV